MYKIIDDVIYYKTENMSNYIPFGKVFDGFATETENEFEIKKFNLELEEYEHSDELTEYNGYEVTDGFYYVEPIIPEPTEEEIFRGETMLNQCEILINQENQDMVLAEILIGQLGV